MIIIVIFYLSPVTKVLQNHIKIKNGHYEVTV